MNKKLCTYMVLTTLPQWKRPSSKPTKKAMVLRLTKRNSTAAFSKRATGLLRWNKSVNTSIFWRWYNGLRRRETWSTPSLTQWLKSQKIAMSLWRWEVLWLKSTLRRSWGRNKLRFSRGLSKKSQRWVRIKTTTWKPPKMPYHRLARNDWAIVWWEG